MKIEIEVYKGQTIFYDDDNDKFVCDMTSEDLSSSAKRGSLKDTRNAINQFVKANLDFKPFKVIVKDWGDPCVKNVTAIRTDGKLVIDGSYYGLSDCSKKVYVYNADVEGEIQAIKALETQYANSIRARKVVVENILVKADVSKYDLK